MSQEYLANVILRPHVSEKAHRLSMDHNQFVCEVLPCADKLSIKKAVELLFGVEVKSVNTSHVKGKVRRVGQKIGRRQDWKKAVVTLKPGHSIDLAGKEST
jgi:large subunit ribosomal protein L23